jgi:hypothetical protein
MHRLYAVKYFTFTTPHGSAAASARGQPPHGRVNWPERDRELSARVDSAAARLRAIAPPVRVSRIGLAREVSGRFSIFRASQLPATNALIAAATGTHAQFALRRMGWLAEQLRAESPESRGTRKRFVRRSTPGARGVLRAKSLTRSLVAIEMSSPWCTADDLEKLAEARLAQEDARTAICQNGSGHGRDPQQKHRDDRAPAAVPGLPNLLGN